MLRAIMGWLAIFGAVSAAHADAPGPQPITQYETPAEERWAPFSSNLPTCDDTGVLSTDLGSLRPDREHHTGAATTSIAGIDGVREIGFRANGLAYIPRRYCVGRAAVVDPRAPAAAASDDAHGRLQRGRRGGIIGWSWGVEWCVVGFDRNHAYAPDCDVLRPILERWLGEQPAVVKARY